MNLLVFQSSNATKNISHTLKCDTVDVFEDNKFNITRPILELYEKEIQKSDAIITNGTWGSDIRKNLVNPSFGPNDATSYLQKSSYLDFLNTHLVEIARNSNKPLIVLESSTISRSIANKTDRFSHKEYKRMGLGGWTYGSTTWLTPEEYVPNKYRLVSFYNHSWKFNEKGCIYIITGLEWDPTSTKPVTDFIKNSIEEIRFHTNRKICIKPHPLSFTQQPSRYEYFAQEYENVELVSGLLKEHYNDMYVAVIDNSTSIFELIERGIPTYTSIDNFGSKLGNTELNTINDPYLASKEEVLEWTMVMSCTELPSQMFADKTIASLIEKLSLHFEKNK